MNKLVRSKTFWLATIASALFALAIGGGLCFCVYEFQVYGKVAYSYPEGKLANLLDITGEQIDAQSDLYGFRPLDNPFFGPHALAIDASQGSWLVSFKFNADGTSEDYRVMYSNVNSAIYHNKVVHD